MVSPVKNMSSQIDPNFQQQLYELVRLANIVIDPHLFGVILDLMRNGVSPDSIYAFLVKASKLSPLGQRVRGSEENSEKERRKEKTVPPQNENVGDERSGQ